MRRAKERVRERMRRRAKERERERVRRAKEQVGGREKEEEGRQG
jgi:hypothetical protein